MWPARARQRVVFWVPELTAVQFDTYRRSIRHLGGTEGRRLGRPLEDFDARIFDGALTVR